MATIYDAIAPERSYMDYQRESAQLDALRQQGQINALRLAEAQRGEQERNALREAFSGVTSAEQAIPQLYRRGLYEPALRLEEAGRKRREGEATIGLREAERVNETLKTYQSYLPQIASPEQFAQYLRAQYDDPVLGPHMRRLNPSYEDAIAKIPSDPQGFKDHLLKVGLGMKNYADMLLKAQGKDHPLSQAMQQAGLGQEQQRAAWRSYIDKQTTHAPPQVTVGLMAPQPMVNPETGQTEMVSPPNRPGAPPQPLRAPGGKAYQPPPRTNETTEQERLAAGYYTRMTEATKLLDKFEATGKPTVLTGVAGAIPMVGETARRFAMTADQGRYRQAQEDWVRAKLRKESGAAIGKEEMDREIATYFPQVGDAPEVVAQKRQARDVANQAMLQAAGRATGLKAAPPASGGGVVNWSDLK